MLSSLIPFVVGKDNKDKVYKVNSTRVHRDKGNFDEVNEKGVRKIGSVVTCAISKNN